MIVTLFEALLIGALLEHELRMRFKTS